MKEFIRAMLTILAVLGVLAGWVVFIAIMNFPVGPLCFSGTR